MAADTEKQDGFGGKQHTLGSAAVALAVWLSGTWTAFAAPLADDLAGASGRLVAEGTDTTDSDRSSAAADTDSSSSDPPQVVIYGRGEQRIGRAEAASEGAVGGADLSVRPLLRVAELLEAVP